MASNGEPMRPAIEPIVDQVAPAALDHPGDDGPEGVNRAEPVHPHEPLGLVGPEIGERAVGADAGVGHQHIRRPELVLQVGDGRREPLGVGDVGDRVPGGAVEPGHDGSEVVLAAGDQPHPGAPGGGGLGDRPTDARGTCPSRSSWRHPTARIDRSAER